MSHTPTPSIRLNQRARAMDNKRKIDAHDELVATLSSLEFAASAALGLTGGRPPETKIGVAIKQARAVLAKVDA